MERIIIEPGNPHDFSSAELDDLSAAMTGAAPDVEVRIGVRDERGYGVSLIEVIHVFVENMELVVAGGSALGGLVGWLRKRVRKDGRQRSVVIWGSDGRPLKSLRIEDSELEPLEDEVPDGRRTPPSL